MDGEELGPAFLLKPEAARLESSRQAWILSRYADVSAALRKQKLSRASARSGAPAGVIDETAHSEFRDSARAALSTARIAEWRARIAPMGDRMAGALLPSCPVDL